jgi:hypothetical protein
MIAKEMKGRVIEPFRHRLLSTFLLGCLSGIFPLTSFAAEVDPIAEEFLSSPEDATEQMTSVSQLSDVQPTDWAYQALRSLIERYGCIAGYPNRTYQGDRALTRCEFAAGLNACLNFFELLLQENEAVAKQDIEKLQRLAQDFATELASLGARVDNLESRVAFLEDHQFSTTVKLSGSAILAVSDAFVEGFDNQTIFQYRYRLLLSASFTGKDNLLIGIYAGNAIAGNADEGELLISTGSFALPGVETDTPFGIVTTSTAEGGLTSTTGATTDNRLLLLATKYSFPVGDRLNVHVSLGRAPYYFYAPILNGLYTGDEGTGAIGVFVRHDPAYLLVGGGSGITFNYNLTDTLELTAGYLADGGTVGDPNPGNGLFNGGYGVLGQLTWKASDQLTLGVVYVHDYALGGRFGFNSNGLGSAGTAVANTLAGQDALGGEDFGLPQSAVVTNGYSAQFSWQPTSSFVLSGWFGTYYPRLIGRGDGNILTYALTFGFPDLGREGNLLGLVVGAEPYLTRMGGTPIEFAVDIPWHIEAFYRHQITNNISLTPGLIWLTTPDQDNSNPDALIATIRTTFSF